MTENVLGLMEVKESPQLKPLRDCATALVAATTDENKLQQIIALFAWPKANSPLLFPSPSSQTETISARRGQTASQKGVQKAAVKALEYLRRKAATVEIADDITERQRLPILSKDRNKAHATLRKRMLASAKRFRHYPETDEWELWSAVRAIEAPLNPDDLK